MDPGDGRQPPQLIFSISSIISAPFLGDRPTIEMIQGLSHPRLIPPQCLCPHMIPRRYRISDIGFIRPSLSAPWSIAEPCLTSVASETIFLLSFQSPEPSSLYNGYCLRFTGQ